MSGREILLVVLELVAAAGGLLADLDVVAKAVVEQDAARPQ